MNWSRQSCSANSGNSRRFIGRFSVMRRRGRWGKTVVALLAAIMLTDLSPQLAPGQTGPADRPPIVLRNLKLIRDRSIAEFDDSSITLSDGSRLGWDEVLQATVEPGQQTEFNARLNSIGLPSFRLKSRIQVGDWAGAGEIAESRDDQHSASEQAASGWNDPNTFYLAALAKMKSRIARGDRIGAIAPFLRAASLQPQVDDPTRQIAGTSWIPKMDLETGLSHELIPIWFDDHDLGRSSQPLTRRLENLIPASPSESTGPSLYLASIKIELGETDDARRLLNSMGNRLESIAGDWITVLNARIHQKKDEPLKAQAILQSNINELSGQPRLAGLYYLGINALNLPDLSDADYSAAILTLLRIPAEYGDQHRDLSAAALFQAVQIARVRGREQDALKLGNELLRRYPRTYHGRLESKRRTSQKR